MTYEIVVGDGVATIHASYADEGVDLTVSREVRGGEPEAQQYVRFFDSDTRNNFSHLFPVPVVGPPEHPGGGV